MLNFGTVSYGLAAVGFLVLTLLLAISWEGRGQGVRLIVACGVTSAWAALLAYVTALPQLPLALVTLAEFLRDGAWLVVLTGLISGGTWPAFLTRITHLLVAVTIVAAAGLLLFGQRLGTADIVPAVFSFGGLALSLAGLVLIEQVYRNANPGGRYALKYLVVGLGVMCAYDLFLFSQAQLVRGIEAASWQARGIVNALVVPLIALAARANPTWSLNVFISRQAVFYTTSFLAVGAYLLVMSAGGYAIRFYGGTWGRVAQIVFFAGAGIVLLALMTSGSLRRRLRVFLSKHFYRNKYDYRVEWLRFIDTLSSRESGADTADTYENSVRAVAQIIGSRGGMLFLASEGGEGYVPAAGWPADGFARSGFPVLAADDELLRFIRRRQWVFDLDEYRSTPDAYDSIEVPRFLRGHSRLRLIVPLLLQDELLGLVLLAEPPPPFDLTWEDRDLLKTVGRHVATHLAQHEADRRLAESRQFEAYHRLTAFVMHDLKNLAAQLSLLLTNAAKHKRNPEFVDDAIETIANSTARMQRLIEQLQGREIQSRNRRVSLAEVAREACTRCALREPQPRNGELAPDALVEADPERLGMMIEHLIRNAQDATSVDGSVFVEVTVQRSVELEPLSASGIRAVTAQQVLAAEIPPAGGTGPSEGLPADYALLTVEDNGSGMSPDFVKERLFKPFDTTKGSKGMGIGAYQVREYVRGLGGRLKVDSEPGRGTIFAMWLPIRLGAAEGGQA